MNKTLRKQYKTAVRCGLSDEERPYVWLEMSGAAALLESESALYASLRCREKEDIQNGYTCANNPILAFAEMIDRGIDNAFSTDVYRTFPDDPLFRPRQDTKSKQGSIESVHEFNSLLVSPGKQRNLSRPLALIAQSLSTLASSVAKSLSTDTNNPPSLLIESNQVILSLRRILVAFAYYSWPHPDSSKKPSRTCTYQIGYCQSLNVVVGFILSVFAQTESGGRSAFAESGSDAARELVETRVFWLLVAVVERILPPETYGHSLEGARIQQEILWRFVLPSLGVPRFTAGAAATTQWFLALFVAAMPSHASRRLWDFFLCHGEKTLYRIAAALIAPHATAIAFSDHAEACATIAALPSTVSDPSTIINLAFPESKDDYSLASNISIFSQKSIDKLRAIVINSFHPTPLLPLISHSEGRSRHRSASSKSQLIHTSSMMILPSTPLVQPVLIS